MKYGFIGLGNMAGAIIAGMAACGKFKNDYLYGFNRSQGKTLALKEKHGLIPCASPPARASAGMRSALPRACPL